MKLPALLVISLFTVEDATATPCYLPSPHSVDSGYDTAEFSPGDSLGYVKEIDQFLDSFELGSCKELLHRPVVGELELLDERSLGDDQTKKYEVEESNVNIEEFVQSLTSGHQTGQKSTNSSQEIIMYDINGQGFTVLKVDPIYPN